MRRDAQEESTDFGKSKAKYFSPGIWTDQISLSGLRYFVFSRRRILLSETGHDTTNDAKARASGKSSRRLSTPPGRPGNPRSSAALTEADGSAFEDNGNVQ